MSSLSPSFLDLLPVRFEDVNSIRARVDSDLNAGVDPSSPRYIDTTEGGFWWDVSQPLIIEMARLYDFGSTEVPASMHLPFSYGLYLDYWGVTLNLPRKDSVAAGGAVTFTGTNGLTIPTGTRVGTVRTDPDADPVEYATTNSGTIAGGAVTLPVQAVAAGSAGNVGAGAVTQLLSPVGSSAGAVSAVTNSAAITGGTDVESDDDYKSRMLLAFASPAGAGSLADYRAWALAFPGVGGVSVVGLWNGPGTVKVIVVDPDGQPVAPSVVSDLQAYLDPGVGGSGAGVAPVGAIVTVATALLFVQRVVATVVFEPGYSLDGTGGTSAVRTLIEDALIDYFSSLAPGQTVVYQHVLARFFAVEGVHDVTTMTLNGAKVNTTLQPDEIAYATPSDLTLT